MGNKYEIIAAHYPFKGYYEASHRTDSFLSFIWHLIKFQRKGYEIIDVAYRNVKIDTSNWKNITYMRGD